MAILLNTAGKTVETNEATLRRLAKDRGDVIAFTKRPHFSDVLLNSKPVGRLFESHEKAIAYLSNVARLKPAPRAAAKRNPASAGPTMQDALSALLLGLGFDAMAREVKTEKDPERLQRYAKVILKQSPQAKRQQITQAFRRLGLM